MIKNSKVKKLCLMLSPGATYVWLCTHGHVVTLYIWCKSLLFSSVYLFCMPSNGWLPLIFNLSLLLFVFNLHYSQTYCSVWSLKLELLTHNTPSPDGRTCIFIFAESCFGRCSARGLNPFYRHYNHTFGKLSLQILLTSVLC